MFLNLFQAQSSRPHIRCRCRDLCHRKLRSPCWIRHKSSLSKSFTMGVSNSTVTRSGDREKLFCIECDLISPPRPGWASTEIELVRAPVWRSTPTARLLRIQRDAADSAEQRQRTNRCPACTARQRQPGCQAEAWVFLRKRSAGCLSGFRICSSPSACPFPVRIGDILADHG
jgi:hypothetical protein